MAAKTIKFNAGKVQYDEETKRCTPLPFKGVVSIKPNADEEEFYDFTWTPKSNTTRSLDKDELLIIPGDVSFKQVQSCKTGRVFALTFLSSGAKNLYWLQDIGDDDELDKLTEKDKSLVKSVEELITPKDDDDDIKEEEPIEPKEEPKE